MRGRILVWGVLLLLLGSGAFVVEGLAGLARATSRKDALVSRLQKARQLALIHPEVFAAREEAAEPVGLKSLVQTVAQERKLRIAFLSETEREAGKGRREKQVSARLAGAAHEPLVRFLSDLEAKGLGAIVKEIRLRPSPEETGVYREAEIVVARIHAAQEGTP